VSALRRRTAKAGVLLTRGATLHIRALIRHRGFPPFRRILHRSGQDPSTLRRFDPLGTHRVAHLGMGAIAGFCVMRTAWPSYLRCYDIRHDEMC
jgi:hypothetical protein